MARILLVEPDYRSKFPPLGLLKIGAYHKSVGDEVTFVRGRHATLRLKAWDRVYVSSLFTWELPATVDTIRHYAGCVESEQRLVVGGIGATLLPEYIKARVPCRIIQGPLNRGGMISRGIPALDGIVPDYSIIENSGYDYRPRDSYFSSTTRGCIRRCKFCAVSRLEPCFYYVRGWWKNIEQAARDYGERQHLMLLDNNVLAAREKRATIFKRIRELGFERDATLGGLKRKVDFNQGIDARLITRETAVMLATVNLEPVRLAFDTDGMESAYSNAIARLSEVGFKRFTNYVMYNFNESPRSFYYRLKTNFDLAERYGVAITGFPMRFTRINSVNRGHVCREWCRKYLRGVRCILIATRGLVSTNRDFFHRAFGSNADEFLRIVSMPDKYIIYRSKYEFDGACDWRRSFSRLSQANRRELLGLLGRLSSSNVKRVSKREFRRFGRLLRHYYGESTLRIGQSNE